MDPTQNRAPIPPLSYLFASTFAFFITASFFVPEPYAKGAFLLGSIFGWLSFMKGLNHFASHFPSWIEKGLRWAHALSFESMAIIFTGLIRPTGYLFSHKKGLGRRNGRPVLLIHGYLHDCSGWIYLKKRLAREGHGPIYVINLKYPFLSIREYGKRVKIKAEEIEKETGRKDLILIGHSMGGLVSSWYATKVAEAGTVTDVMTIGSPLKGTFAAKIALGPNGREMERNSSFVSELQLAILENKDIRFYHIGTLTDQLIIPSGSALLEGDLERQFVVNDIGHVTLLFSPRIGNKLSHWLKQIEVDVFAKELSPLHPQFAPGSKDPVG